ncbi:MAG: hypothetical protein Q8M94_11000 [Ignavibacteria bacterium]|nr:hypothetical protein [Ignavibacteria bacterium]
MIKITSSEEQILTDEEMQKKEEAKMKIGEEKKKENLKNVAGFLIIAVFVFFIVGVMTGGDPEKQPTQPKEIKEKWGQLYFLTSLKLRKDKEIN